MTKIGKRNRSLLNNLSRLNFSITVDNYLSSAYFCLKLSGPQPQSLNKQYLRGLSSAKRSAADAVFHTQKKNNLNSHLTYSTKRYSKAAFVHASAVIILEPHLLSAAVIPASPLPPWHPTVASTPRDSFYRMISCTYCDQGARFDTENKLRMPLQIISSVSQPTPMGVVAAACNSKGNTCVACSVTSMAAVVCSCY